MPWAFHKDGKTNLYGDSSLVFGLTHFSYTTKNHLAEFSSNATEFHVTLWNLNYGVDVVKDNPHVIKEANDVVKGKANVTKEFAKAQRQIYKLISQTPQISAAQMSENMGISLRQVQRYLKQLSDQNLIVREGGRKNGVWKILDDEYEGFFKRI